MAQHFFLPKSCSCVEIVKGIIIVTTQLAGAVSIFGEINISLISTCFASPASEILRDSNKAAEALETYSTVFVARGYLNYLLQC